MAYQVVVPRRQQDGTTTTVTFNIRVKDPLNAIPKAKATTRVKTSSGRMQWSSSAGALPPSTARSASTTTPNYRLPLPQAPVRNPDSVL
jgi:hypothetical protein